MWVLADIHTGKILCWGTGTPPTEGVDTIQGAVFAIPKQDMALLLRPDRPEEAPVLRECYYPRDVRLFTAEEMAVNIDAKTDAAIQSALHPCAARGEESAIHRGQLQSILDKLGLTPTEKFRGLTELADKAVAEGKDRKATTAKAA